MSEKNHPERKPRLKKFQKEFMREYSPGTRVLNTIYHILGSTQPDSPIYTTPGARIVKVRIEGASHPDAQFVRWDYKEIRKPIDRKPDEPPDYL